MTPESYADQVVWDVEDDPTDAVQSPVPSVAPRGASTSFVAVAEPTHWSTVPHPGTLDQKSLAYRVRATVEVNGTTVSTDATEVRQDEIDTIRQEYLDLHQHRVPDVGDFSPEPRVDVGANTGDYGYMVFNNAFAGVLNTLGGLWWDRWQVNSIYRNPVHQIKHLGQKGNSAHEYHCAADLQTFPARQLVGGVLVFNSAADSLAALTFWNRLADMVDSAGLHPEPLGLSGVGHVHAERRGC